MPYLVIAIFTKKNGPKYLPLHNLNKKSEKNTNIDHFQGLISFELHYKLENLLLKLRLHGYCLSRNNITSDRNCVYICQHICLKSGPK